MTEYYWVSFAAVIVLLVALMIRDSRKPAPPFPPKYRVVRLTRNSGVVEYVAEEYRSVYGGSVFPMEYYRLETFPNQEQAQAYINAHVAAIEGRRIVKKEVVA